VACGGKHQQSKSGGMRKAGNLSSMAKAWRGIMQQHGNAMAKTMAAWHR